MSAEYSVEAILNAANVCGGTVGKMLTAYAERIEADESAEVRLAEYLKSQAGYACLNIHARRNVANTFLTVAYPAYPPAQAAHMELTEADAPSGREAGYIDTPTAEPASQADGWQRLTDAVRDQQAKHLGNHQGDVYHAMQYIGSKFGKPETRPMIESLTTAEPVAQGEEGNGVQFEYRRLSLPNSDGEQTWLPWQKFDPKMQIRCLVTHPHSPNAADSGRVDAMVARFKTAFAERSSISPEYDGCIRAGLEAALAAQGQGDAVATVTVRDENGMPYIERMDHSLPVGTHELFLHPVPPASPAGVPDGESYDVRKKGGTDEWGIYLRGLNVRVATFAKGSATARKRIAAMLAAAPSATPEGGEVGL